MSIQVIGCSHSLYEVDCFYRIWVTAKNILVFAFNHVETLWKSESNATTVNFFLWHSSVVLMRVVDS